MDVIVCPRGAKGPKVRFHYILKDDRWDVSSTDKVSEADMTAAMASARAAIAAAGLPAPVGEAGKGEGGEGAEGAVATYDEGVSEEIEAAKAASEGGKMVRVEPAKGVARIMPGDRSRVRADEK